MISAINRQLKKLAAQKILFKTDIDPQLLWNKYLASFPEGTNPIYKTRTEHDCNTCKQVVRFVGGVIAIDQELSVTTMWDDEDDCAPEHRPVLDAMRDFVIGAKITGIYVPHQNKLGAKESFKKEEDGSITRFTHLYSDIPTPSLKSTAEHDVFTRAMTEWKASALLEIIEMVEQNMVYRGNEHLEELKTLLNLFEAHATTSLSLQERFRWYHATKSPNLARLRNTSLGTLVTDISEGTPTEQALKKYEAMVAPSNYRRPAPTFSQKQLEQAKQQIETMGINLERRFATLDDLTVNELLFVNRDVKPAVVSDDPFESLSKPTEHTKNATAITAKEFIDTVLPTATSLDVLVENRHRGNFMSLIAPVKPSQSRVFKWNNDYSWTYQGNIADSMKALVKSMGGNIVADLRCSIRWNESGKNQNDFDLHCLQPAPHQEIWFSNKGYKCCTSGMLDVDIITPGQKVACENITFTDAKKMPVGSYEFFVHVFSYRGGSDGFRAEIEFNGETHEFDYCEDVRQDQRIPIATVTKTRSGELTIKCKLPSTSSRQPIWGLQTQSWQPVYAMSLSPNYWGDNSVGNKHYLFFLKGCRNPDTPSGFFNEYLNNELTQHKRVFEALCSRVKVAPSDDQLSGLGFSESRKDGVTVKVNNKDVYNLTF